MNIEKTPVNGTCRQRVVTKDGIKLERQFLYAKRETWVMLAKLASEHGTGGSQVFEKLVNVAYAVARNRQVE